MKILDIHLLSFFEGQLHPRRHPILNFIFDPYIKFEYDTIAYNGRTTLSKNT